MRKAAEIKVYGDKKSYFLEKDFAGYEITEQSYSVDECGEKETHHTRIHMTFEEFDLIFSGLNDLSKIKIKEGV